MITTTSATSDNSIKESNLSVSYNKESATLNFPGLQADNSHEEPQTSSSSAQKVRFSIVDKPDADKTHCGQLFLQTLRSFFCCSRLSSYISSSRLNCCAKSEILSADEQFLQLDFDVFLSEITHLPDAKKIALLEKYNARDLPYDDKNVSLDTEKVALLEEYNTQDFPEHKQPGSVYQVNQRNVLHMAADGNCFFRSIMCASTSSDKYASCDKSMLFDDFSGKPDLYEKFTQCMKKAEEEISELFPNADKAVLEMLHIALYFMKCFPAIIYKSSSVSPDAFTTIFPKSTELAEECHKSLDMLSDVVFTLLNAAFSSIPFYLESEHYDLYLN